MKHDYTDEEIKEAENEAYRTMPVAKEHEWVKAFLAALPERDKAQGILKDCLAVMPFGNIETHTAENLPGRIADLASEIAAVSSENERLESELAAIRQPILADDGRTLDEVYMQAYNDAPDDSSVHEASKIALRAVAAVVLAQAVRQPILADDGRTLGQVAFEAAEYSHKWAASNKFRWQAVAKAVVAAARPAIDAECLAQAIRRMEAVPVNEMWKTFRRTNSLKEVRARLISAFKGEGQAMAKNIPGDKCPVCGAEEVESNTPSTTYACGSSDYDGRPGTFHPGDKCEAPVSCRERGAAG